MAEGVANIMNNYSKALESTGVPGTQALDITKGMVTQLGNLNVAQKAFLSAQTGGAGGLRGAFQIEEEMSKNPAAIMEKVRNEMTREMGGHLVTRQEAADSESAARQYQKQISMIRGGALGPLAKTDQDAERISEMFKQMNEGTISKEELNKNILEKSIDEGTKLQSQSLSYVNEILGHVEALHRIADHGSYGFLRNSLSASAGEDAGHAQSANAARLRQNRDVASRINKSVSGETYGGSMARGYLGDNFGVNAISEIKSTYNTLSNLLTASKAPAEEVVKIFNSFRSVMNDSPKERAQGIKLLEADREKRKVEMSNASGDKKAEIQNVISAETSMIDYAKQLTDGRSENKSPSKRVGAAAVRAVDVRQAQDQQQAQNAATHEQHSSEVDIRVTGFCVKCKNDFDLSVKKTNSRQKAVNPAVAANR
jgi:hypothetical protein